jgi:hypothetical protein
VFLTRTKWKQKVRDNKSKVKIACILQANFAVLLSTLMKIPARQSCMMYRPTKSWLMTLRNISPSVLVALPLNRPYAGLMAIRSANNPRLLGIRANGVMIEYTVPTQVSLRK